MFLTFEKSDAFEREALLFENIYLILKNLDLSYDSCLYNRFKESSFAGI